MMAISLKRPKANFFTIFKKAGSDRLACGFVTVAFLDEDRVGSVIGTALLYRADSLAQPQSFHPCSNLSCVVLTPPTPPEREMPSSVSSVNWQIGRPPSTARG